MSFLDLCNENLIDAFYHDGDAYRDPFDFLNDLSYSFFCLEGVLDSAPVEWRLAA